MSAHALLFNTECPSPGLRLFNVSGGHLLARQDLPGGDGSFSFDVGAMGLPAGSYQLALSAVNAYRCESERALMTVEVGVGGEVGGFIDAQDVVTEVLAGGLVGVQWWGYSPIQESDEQTEPVEYEVAEVGDLGAVLAVVAWNPSRYFLTLVGPFADGLSKTFAVRASDGVVGGVRGGWVMGEAVVVDAVGPAVPDIDEGALPAGCGCG